MKASITAFGREYIAISDGLHGQEIPLQYDGTNLDRVTQDHASDSIERLLGLLRPWKEDRDLWLSGEKIMHPADLSSPGLPPALREALYAENKILYLVLRDEILRVGNVITFTPSESMRELILLSRYGKRPKVTAVAGEWIVVAGWDRFSHKPGSHSTSSLKFLKWDEAMDCALSSTPCIDRYSNAPYGELATCGHAANSLIP